jgi:hypothetical protein
MDQGDLRFWRYCDELSVIDAALLIVGLNPGVVEIRGRPVEEARLVQPSIEGEDRYFHEHSFRAVFKALRYAVLRDKLSANISRLSRNPSYQWVGGETRPEFLADGEVELQYDRLVTMPGKLYSTSRVLDGGFDGKVYVIAEPDWFQTTLNVENLKAWLVTKGDRPDFFFPEERAFGFQDPSHPRYSSKLAAAVAAWDGVESAAPNKSVKQTIERWLRENAASFGLVDDNGNPLSDVISELAKVVNWNTKGGAPKTAAGQSEELAERRSNFYDAGDFGEVPF